MNGGNDANGSLILTGNVTLNGGGTVVLTTATGGGSAFLYGNGETLTNSDTIEGTGVIGNGSLTLTSSGTIDADSSAGTGTLTVNGSGAVTNTGTFEATAGGYLDVADALGGAGAVKVGANSTVELGGATSENATFLSATAATLLIDNATTAGEYSGVLNSFAVGDILELGSTDATSATPTAYNGTDTTLTVDLSSGGPLTYTLAGDYMSDKFSVALVGSNSEITDPAFAEAATLLGGHHHRAKHFAEFERRLRRLQRAERRAAQLGGFAGRAFLTRESPGEGRRQWRAPIEPRRPSRRRRTIELGM